MEQPIGERTVEAQRDGADARRKIEPHLFLVLECHRPLSGGARASLAGVDEVTFGRGVARGFVRDGGSRSVGVRVPDPLMSSTHARLVRDDGAWAIEDLGSTNGTRVAGQRIGARTPLADGSILEMGSTFFVVRTALATPEGTPPTADGMALPHRELGLGTLVPSYAASLATFARVAASDVPVLLLGETGTGKEVLARAVHALSGRPGAFVAVNCGALPESLVEGQLFGHVKGAFSGALRDEPGFVRASDHGTLFLDEIGDLPRTSQAALLRVLQEREVTPVGSTRAHKVDLRVVAATHRRVDALDGAQDAAAATGDAAGFRADLYARLAGFTHELPPLRQRKEDLGQLVSALLPGVAGDRAPRLRLATELGRALLRYDWPRNVRELQQALSVAAVLADDVVQLAHAPDPVRRAASASQATGAHAASASQPPPPRASTTTARPPAEEPRLSADDERLRAELIAALTASRGNVSEIARAMGKTRMQIHRWMRRFAIDPESFRR